MHSRQFRPWVGAGVGALWLWWAVCSLLLLGLWITARTNGVHSLLSERRAEVTAGLRSLGEAFAQLHRLQLVLAAQESLTPELTAQAEPYMRLRARSGEPVGVSRPQPPAMEAGRAHLAAPAASYLWVVGPDLVAELDLGYVFGPWLNKQVGRFAQDFRLRQVSPSETWERPNLIPLAPAPVMTWRLPSLFAQEPYPFDAVEIEVDCRPALAEMDQRYGAALLGGSLVMLSFALAIGLAQRGLRRELELVEARNQFMALVSHELRTPVAALRMYTEILEHGLIDDQEKLASYRRILSQEANRLGFLVENLLEVGALERGGRSFRREPFDLNELVRAHIAEAELGSELPSVVGDREATARVLANLLDNARKYGTGRVRVATRRTSQGVLLEVSDDGPGIPAAERQRIFEPYRRLQESGVGLGLALVKSFVEGQGGRVSVEGSVFRVELPT